MIKIIIVINDYSQIADIHLTRHTV